MPAIPGKHVVYFALQPPPETAAEIVALLADRRTAFGLTAKPISPDRLHVPLNAVGDFKRPPGPVIEKAVEAAKPVTAPPVDVRFDRVGSWAVGSGPGPIVLWGDQGPVADLYSTIHRALVKPGMAPRREPEMTPHMMLMNDVARPPETEITPIAWTADAFALIYAIPAENRFEVVETFPLNG